MKPEQIAVLVVAATLGLLIVLLLLYGRPRRARQEPLPTNFSRGDPDSVLEGSRLVRVQVWGVAAAIFITGFLTVYFVIEPFREAAYGKKFLAASVDRGKIEFSPDAAKHQVGANCASCHGPTGEGGFAATDPSWPAPPLNNVLTRYSRDDVLRIVKMGRPGTPMPSWGIEFGGPLNDQKIEDVVNFVTTFQVTGEKHWELPKDVKDGKDVFARKCAVCHGTNAQGQALGQPLPTFFAPDLTTEFYRLGLKVAKVNVTTDLKNKLLAKHAENTDPTPEDVQAAMAKLSAGDIMKFGEEAARNTIMRGRQNTPMPAWQNRIRPEHIDAVLNYLKSIQKSGQGTGG
jgi:mono/diheme cytochrome c family protein